MCTTDVYLEGAENLDKLDFTQEYQFVYMDEDCNVQGVSHVFKFCKLEKSLEPRPRFASHNNEGTYRDLEGETLDHHKNNCLTKPNFSGSYRRNQQLRSYNDKNKSKQGYKNKGQLWGRGGEVRPPQPPQVTFSCSNCHRVTDLLSTQHKLYTQVKYLAEKNSDLEEELQEMRQRLELCQAANQKLNVMLSHERNLRLYYQVAAVPPELLKSQQVAMLESAPPSPHPQAHREDKIRANHVLKLKALIGTQEEKIRTLTKQLSQFQMQSEEFKKVKAVIKSFDDLILNEPNNNDVQHIAKENTSD